MKCFNRFITVIALVIAQLASTAPASAADGFDVKFEITGLPAGGLSSTWRYLQVLQVHLNELEQNQFLSEIGCVTNVQGSDPNGGDTVDCAELESATQNSPLIGDVRSVTYRVFKSNWAVFRQMANEAADRFAEEETGPVKLARSKTPVSIPEPACSPPAGCYTRAICTMYSGCSKSQYSCVKCN